MIKIIVENKADVKRVIAYENAQFFRQSDALGKKFPSMHAEAWVTFANKCPPLTHARITNEINNGYYGVVYQLNNGHVLKVFRGGLHGANAEIDIYETLQSYAFEGHGAPEDLPVYDFGSVYIELRWNTAYNIYYAEMAELIPLKDWFYRTGRSDSYLSFADVLYHLRGLAENLANSGVPENYEIIKGIVEKMHEQVEPEEYLAYFNSLANTTLPTSGGGTYRVGWNLQTLYREIVGSSSDIQKEEILGTLKALYQRASKGVDIDDAHIGNVGVMPQNPNVMVVFDS